MKGGTFLHFWWSYPNIRKFGDFIFPFIQKTTLFDSTPLETGVLPTLADWKREVDQIMEAECWVHASVEKFHVWAGWIYCSHELPDEKGLG